MKDYTVTTYWTMSGRTVMGNRSMLNRDNAVKALPASRIPPVITNVANVANVTYSQTSETTFSHKTAICARGLKNRLNATV